jgi:CRP/FNR family cyclic AMP-dependent transcriptional regulator
MKLPRGSNLIENCLKCSLRGENFFCDLPDEALRSLEAIKFTSVYPKGAFLFMEGQSPRGIFIICNGQVKLSTSSSEGKLIIIEIAEPGEVLGLSAVLSGMPYEVTAETISSCQVNFIRRDDFLNFLSEYGEVALRVAQQLSRSYHIAYEQIRSLGLSPSARSKLAKLMLDWCDRSGEHTDRGHKLKLILTHEEIAQMIGTSRETVTRLLGEFKSEGLIEVKGSNLLIRNKAALEKMASF